MTDALHKVGERLGQAWQGLAQGWRELVGRSGAALTRFVPRIGRDRATSLHDARFPRWGLLAGEVRETSRSLVVTVELPAVERSDCEVWIDASALRIRGEKRVLRDRLCDRYHLTERAYGWFERTIPLPGGVDADAAIARWRNGVLTVELPKSAAVRGGRVEVR